MGKRTAPVTFSLEMVISGDKSSASLAAGDLSEAQNALKTMSSVMQPKTVEWCQATQVRILLRRKDIAEARSRAGIIAIPEIRIAAKAYLAQDTKLTADLEMVLDDLGQRPDLYSKRWREVTLAALACERIDLARKIAQARSRHDERCLLWAVISMDQKGTQADLEEAVRIQQQITTKSNNDGGARLQLVHALAHHGRHQEAKSLALRINMPAVRANALLVIHRSRTGGDPLPFESEIWDDYFNLYFYAGEEKLERARR